MAILVIDIGGSAVRTAVVRPDGTVVARRQHPFAPQQAMPGLVELDARAIASSALTAAHASLEEVGGVDGVGVTNQRGHYRGLGRETGEPIGPALSWQDLRTVGTCLELQAEGLRLAPNESATKLAWLLDTYDKSRSRELALRYPRLLGDLELDQWFCSRHRPQQRWHYRSAANRSGTGGESGARMGS